MTPSIPGPTPAPAIRWDRVSMAIALLAVGEVLASPIWHDALVEATGTLRDFWSGSGLTGAPFAEVIGFAVTTTDYLATRHLLVPIAVTMMAWRRWPQLGAWIRPVPPSVVAPRPHPAPVVPAPRLRVNVAPRQPTRLYVMGPEHADKYGLVDALTRRRFALGESFVVCGGRCGRAYKLVSCEKVGYTCPADGMSLRCDDAT
jgi:hypothetical protein